MLSFSFFIKISILIFSFRTIEKILGKKITGRENSINDPEKKRQIVKKISANISRVKKIVPWKSNCYDQALLAVIFLRWFKINYKINFGVKKKSEHKLKAHAWVLSSGVAVTGVKESKGFIITGSYTNL